MNMENYNYIICPICQKQYKTLKTKHIESHGFTLQEFNVKYPKFKKICQEVSDKKKICDANYRLKNQTYFNEYFKNYNEKNRELKRDKQKKYKLKNQEKVKQSDKEYAAKHKNRKKIYDKNYRNKNIEHLKEKSKKYRTSERGRTKKIEWNKKDYKKQKYKYAWRRLLYFYFRNNGEIKSKRTHELLGYSYLQLKQRIETQFTCGMSWENYGEWHIDHKKPLCAFKKNTPPHIVNALCNLQPLWKTTRIINGTIYLGNLNKNSKFK